MAILLTGMGILWLLLVGVQYDSYLFSYPYLTKITLGYPQRHLPVKKQKKRYNFTPPTAVVDDTLPARAKSSLDTLQYAQT